MMLGSGLFEVANPVHNRLPASLLESTGHDTDQTEVRPKLPGDLGG